MGAHEVVLALDELGALGGVLAVQVGVCTSVDGLLTVDQLPEIRAELFVGAVTGSPEGVATNLRDSVVVEVGDACGLALMDEITAMIYISLYPVV